MTLLVGRFKRDSFLRPDSRSVYLLVSVVSIGTPEAPRVRVENAFFQPAEGKSWLLWCQEGRGGDTITEAARCWLCRS